MSKEPEAPANCANCPHPQHEGCCPHNVWDATSVKQCPCVTPAEPSRNPEDFRSQRGIQQPIRTGFMRQVPGSLRCVRCDWKCSPGQTVEQDNVELHAHLDAVHPGWQDVTLAAEPTLEEIIAAVKARYPKVFRLKEEPYCYVWKTWEDREAWLRSGATYTSVTLTPGFLGNDWRDAYAKLQAAEDEAKPAWKCDGNHALPKCIDPQCWHKPNAPDPELEELAAGKAAVPETMDGLPTDLEWNNRVMAEPLNGSMCGSGNRAGEKLVSELRSALAELAQTKAALADLRGTSERAFTALGLGQYAIAALILQKGLGIAATEGSK